MVLLLFIICRHFGFYLAVPEVFRCSGGIPLFWQCSVVVSVFITCLDFVLFPVHRTSSKLAHFCTPSPWYSKIRYPDILPKDTLPKDILPKDILPNGHFADGRFAERTFCRTDSLPKGQLAERTICRK